MSTIIMELTAGEYGKTISFPLTTTLTLTGATVEVHYTNATSGTSGTLSGAMSSNTPTLAFTAASPVLAADEYTLYVELTGTGYHYYVGPYYLKVNANPEA